MASKEDIHCARYSIRFKMLRRTSTTSSRRNKSKSGASVDFDVASPSFGASSIIAIDTAAESHAHTKRCKHTIYDLPPQPSDRFKSKYALRTFGAVSCDKVESNGRISLENSSLLTIVMYPERFLAEAARTSASASCDQHWY